MRFWSALLAVLLFPLPAVEAQDRPAPLRSRSAHSERVTFSNEIVRIFQEHCQVCHHPGEVAPFSLLEYRDAWLFSPFIKDAVQSRYMPPWKPVEGRFDNARGLNQREIDLITHWVNIGAPEGDRRLLPEPLEFSNDWTLGEPDLILQIPTPYEPSRAGSDDYRCFSIPTNLGENRRIGAIEVRPGNREIVHHVILFPDPTGESATLGAPGDPQPGYTCFGDPGFSTAAFLGGWAPGNRPQVMPPGVASTLNAGSHIAMQVHYHPDGTRQTDQTRVGIHFSDEPNPRELTYLPLLNDTFVVPAGAGRHQVTAQFTSPLRARIYSLLPHMHLLGREIRLEVTPFGGATQTLIAIDDWDFDWQDTYWLEEPFLVQPGARLTLTCVYDNTEENAKNPNTPPQAVGWGPKTTDEMALIFIGFALE